MFGVVLCGVRRRALSSELNLVQYIAANVCCRPHDRAGLRFRLVTKKPAELYLNNLISSPRGRKPRQWGPVESFNDIRRVRQKNMQQPNGQSVGGVA